MSQVPCVQHLATLFARVKTRKKRYIRRAVFGAIIDGRNAFLTNTSRRYYAGIPLRITAPRRRAAVLRKARSARLSAKNLSQGANWSCTGASFALQASPRQIKVYPQRQALRHSTATTAEKSVRSPLLGEGISSCVPRHNSSVSFLWLAAWQAHSQFPCNGAGSAGETGDCHSQTNCPGTVQRVGGALSGLLTKRQHLRKMRRSCPSCAARPHDDGRHAARHAEALSTVPRSNPGWVTVRFIRAIAGRWATACSADCGSAASISPGT